MAAFELNEHQTIALIEYEPHPTEPGHQRVKAGRPVRLIFYELSAKLDQEGLVDEYFSLGGRADHLGVLWPTNYRFVSCFAVTGGSEGHYVHVEVIYPDPKPDPKSSVDVADLRKLLFLGKTFQGWDHAWKIAKRCAELLGA